LATKRIALEAISKQSRRLFSFDVVAGVAVEGTDQDARIVVHVTKKDPFLVPRISKFLDGIPIEVVESMVVTGRKSRKRA